MVVIVALPELAYSDRASAGSRRALERSNGLREVRCVGQGDCQNMTMIGHEAICIDGKTVTAKLVAQNTDESLDQSGIGEEFAAAIRTDGEKIVSPTQIVRARKAMSGMFIFHRCISSI